MLSVDVCKVQLCVRLWMLNSFLYIICREQAVLFISVPCSHCAAGQRVGYVDCTQRPCLQSLLSHPPSPAHLPRLWKSPVLQTSWGLNHSYIMLAACLGSSFHFLLLYKIKGMWEVENTCEC